MITNCGGTDYTIRCAETFVEQAKACLGRFEPSEPKTAILALADYVVKRRS
jgi:geranylgeranyl pyrophosphate synthase